MTREFVNLPMFERKWEKIGLDDEDLATLQSMIASDPTIGDMMEGTGGVRKVRVELNNHRGRSHGARVIYVDFVTYEKTYLITAFAKGEKDNLSKSERAAIKVMVSTLKNALRGMQNEQSI